MSTVWFNGDAMAQLARQTGGRFFENNNDLLNGILPAFADGHEEYVLVYSPSDTRLDAQFRRISVEVKDKNFGSRQKLVTGLHLNRRKAFDLPLFAADQNAVAMVNETAASK